MKILIPYDGTKNAENALLDLQNTGCGQDDEILIVITDIFLPESAEEFSRAVNERRLKLEKSGACSYAPAGRRFEEERLLAHEISRCLLFAFPARNIQIETLPGLSLVSSEVLKKAARWKADLIILGFEEDTLTNNTNGYRSGLRRVAAEAECAVRFACGAGGAKSPVKPRCIFIESEDRSVGKPLPEQQKTSNNIAETLLRRQGNCSVRRGRTTKKREPLSKIVPHRPIKAPPEIKGVAHRATASG